MSTEGAALTDLLRPVPPEGAAPQSRRTAPRRTRSPAEYQVLGVGLAHVRNRLELQVIEALRELLPTLPHQCRCVLCVEDVYALSLNRLPAQYIQSGGMVLGGSKGPDAALVRRVVSGAMGQVARRPRHE